MGTQACLAPKPLFLLYYTTLGLGVGTSLASFSFFLERFHQGALDQLIPSLPGLGGSKLQGIWEGSAV